MGEAVLPESFGEADETERIGGSLGLPPNAIRRDDIEVILQPDHNTCVAAALEMMLNDLDPLRPPGLIEYPQLSEEGMNSVDVVMFVSDNLEHINYVLNRGSLEQAIAAKTGFIAILYIEGALGHAVYVRGIEDVQGREHALVLNPACGSYWQPLNEFECLLASEWSSVLYPTFWGTKHDPPNTKRPPD